VKALCTAPDGGSWGRLLERSCGGLPVWARSARMVVSGSHWHFGERIEAMTWASDSVTAYAVAPDSGTVFVLQKGASIVRRLASMPKGSGRLSGIALDNGGGPLDHTQGRLGASCGSPATAASTGWSACPLPRRLASLLLLKQPAPRCM